MMFVVSVICLISRKKVTLPHKYLMSHQIGGYKPEHIICSCRITFHMIFTTAEVTKYRPINQEVMHFVFTFVVFSDLH
jgi:hypothetical protein